MMHEVFSPVIHSQSPQVMAVHLFTYYSRRYFVLPTRMVGVFMNPPVLMASGKLLPLGRGV